MTAICSAAIFITSIVYYCIGCVPDYAQEYVLADDSMKAFRDAVLLPTNRFLGITYFILALLFFTVAITFLHYVQKYHTDFYKQYSKLLWISVLVLTLPLLVRCIMDSLQNWKAYYEYTSQNTALYNLILFFATTYILILSQIATLVFGFVRSQQNKKIGKQKKEIKKS